MKHLSWFKLYTADDVARAIQEWVTPNFRLVEDHARNELVILAPKKYHEKIKTCVHSRMSLSMAYAVVDLDLVGVILARIQRAFHRIWRMKTAKEIYVVAIDEIIQPAREGAGPYECAEIYDKTKALQRAREIGGRAIVYRVMKQNITPLFGGQVEMIQNEWEIVSK